MGFKDLFKRKDSSEDEIKESEEQYAPKWISVSLTTNISSKMDKETIDNIAEDMANIINNTHAVFNDKNEFYGYVNPYLDVNHVSINNQLVTDKPSKKTMVARKTSKPFAPVVTKLDDSWKIALVPCKETEYNEIDSYSLERLNIEMVALAGASDFICNKYNIIIENETPVYEAITINDMPLLRCHDHLIVFEYSVFDRMEYASKCLDLDKYVLGGGCQTIFDFIKEIKTSKMHDEIWTEWLQKIDQSNMEM